MRALVVGMIVLAATTAHAQRVALATGDDQQRTALAVALGGRVDIAPVAPPNGELRLERAAAAQRAAVAIGASAAVWIDDGDVCVVSADGATFRHAPLPGNETPRVFAAIAASLLDELLAPPEAPVRVDVHVELGAPAAFAPPAPATPEIITPSTIAAAPRPAYARRALVELGAMLSPLTAGAEAEIALPLAPRYRVGVLAFADATLRPNITHSFVGTGLELRRVGIGAHHFDVGVEGGAAMSVTPEMQESLTLFAAVRLALVWERPSSSISWSIAVGYAGALTNGLGDGMAGEFPIAWTSLRWSWPV